MARIREFYKGRRKRHNYAMIPFAVALGVLALVLVTFYGLQKYAVITRDGVDVELPMFADADKNVIIDSEGNQVRVFDTVDAPLVFDAPDYSRITATAGKYVSGMRAIFVPAADIKEEKLLEYTQRLSRGNALILEMKPRSGQLKWASNTWVAQSYLTGAPSNESATVERLVGSLKEQGIYLAAQISCCIDDLLTSQTTSASLRTELGIAYRSEEGSWLDPYNATLRDYVVGMVRELFDMGFDEVVLADVRHPLPMKVESTGETIDFVYTQEMSTPPSAVNAVCGFAVYVAQQLSDRTGFLSIYTNSAISLARPDETTGQDAVLFMKLYDRVYIPTDTYAYSYHVADIESKVTIGDVRTRLVPVLTNYLFTDSDNSDTSWVLIDKSEN